MYHRLRNLIALFILVFCTIVRLNAENATEPGKQILILHSYHSSMPWVNDINAGILSKFYKLPSPPRIDIEYMDSKRVPVVQSTPIFEQLLKAKYQNRPLDLIITVDDNALHFLLPRRSIFPDIPIVFGGVNEYNAKKLKMQPLLNGVTEDTDEVATMKMALQLHPKTTQIYIIIDDTPTGKSLKSRLLGKLPDMSEKAEFIFLENMTMKEMQSSVAKLPKNSILMFLSFNLDADGKRYSYRESFAQIRPFIKVPVYSIWSFLLGEGIIGGKLLSGYDHGQAIGERAINILNKKKHMIAPFAGNNYYFDYKELKRAHIPIKNLPPKAIILNPPPKSFLPFAKSYLVITSIIFLLVLILLVRANIRRRRTYKKLLHQDTQLKMIFETAREVAYIITSIEDGYQQVTEFSPGAEDLTGYSRDDALNASPKIFFPPEYAIMQYDKMFDSPLPYNGEVNFLKQDGTSRPCIFHSHPIYNEEDLIVGRLSVAIDISSIKKIESKLKETADTLKETSAVLETMFNAIPDAIAIFNNSDTIISYNQAAADFFGISVDNAMGKARRDVENLLIQPLPGTKEKKRPSAVEMCLTTKHSQKLEKFIPEKEAWIDERAYPICDEDGQLVKVIEQIRDISVEHESQITMERLNKHLEKRVAERTRELQEALKQQEAMQEQLIQSEKLVSLSSLVAGIAHEINTPVGIAVTASSHLEEQTGSLQKIYDNEQLKKSDLVEYLGTAKESTNMILSNLHRASELIKSFKQIAVDQASHERRRFNLQNYLNEVITSLRPELRKGDYEINVECPDNLFLESFPGALSQVLTNLIMNSMIHGFEDAKSGHMQLIVTDEDEGLRIFYSDDGKGIPSSNLKHIFEPFFTTRRGSGGSGLGMNVVYNLVTQTLKGTIVCDSKPGEGVQFTIILPQEDVEISE